MSTTIAESPQDFAARYWGGAEAVAVKSPADRGPVNVDGGRVKYPVHWKFVGDGMTYRVFPARKPKHSWQHEYPKGTWIMEVGYDGCASFIRDGHHWVVDCYGDVRRVLAADRVEYEELPETDEDRQAREEYENRGCECELDWVCGVCREAGVVFTPEERMLDRWASEQSEIDRQHGYF